MPNIELVGFEQSHAESLEALIRESILEESEKKDAVITIVQATVRSCDPATGFKPAPFARVCDTVLERATAIATALATMLHLDVEVPPALSSFIDGSKK